MVLESTMICVDDSDYMRNGDFVPTRLHAQQDAVNLLCRCKTRSNPENNVGLMTLANVQVLATLTTDAGKIMSKIHQVKPNGDIKFNTGMRVAHLALKHRQGKNHKMRIIVFIGSPIASDENDLLQLAKKLKKEKVNVDIVNFGEEVTNTDILTTFINTLNGKDGTGSHLLTVPSGPELSDVLISSPIIRGEDGTEASSLGFEFGVDPEEDPELILALRISMEEQRHKQEEDARQAQAAAAANSPPVVPPVKQATNEERMLELALALSMDNTQDSNGDAMPVADFASMTEEEQISYAMQMSMQDAQQITVDKKSKELPKSQITVDKKSEELPKSAEDDDDYSELINDPEFVQSVLENLNGVDPQSEAVRQAVDSLKKRKKRKKDKK